MRMINIMLLAVVVGLPACTFGKNAAKWRIATQPMGATVKLQWTSGASTGELLEVRDDGVVIMRSDGKLVLAPYAALSRLEAVDLGSGYFVGGGASPEATTRRKFTMVSHFPQGMSPAILTTLLRNSQQSELLPVR